MPPVRRRGKSGVLISVTSGASRAFVHRLHYDIEKQVVILNDFTTPAMASKRKVEATGEGNGRAHAEYFEGLVSKACLQELGAYLIDLTLIQRRDHIPCSYYGDAARPDRLFETAARRGLDVGAIKASATDQPKPRHTGSERVSWSVPGVGWPRQGVRFPLKGGLIGYLPRRNRS